MEPIESVRPGGVGEVMSDAAEVMTNGMGLSMGTNRDNSIEWGHSVSDLVIYLDASLTGLGFTTPLHHLGFCASTPSECLVTTIFYYEALAIASTLLLASGISPQTNHLLVYTDPSPFATMDSLGSHLWSGVLAETGMGWK